MQVPPWLPLVLPTSVQVTEAAPGSTAKVKRGLRSLLRAAGAVALADGSVVSRR